MISRIRGSLGGAPHPALASDYELASLLPDVDRRRLEAYEMRRVERALAAGGFAFSSKTGLILFRNLEWDTTHFGYPCADLTRLYLLGETDEAEIQALLDAGLAEVRSRRMRLVSARLRANQTLAIHALGRHGFRLVDTSVELGGHVEADVETDDIRLGTLADGDKLACIADSFVDNRFYRDPQIDTGKARELYRRWVRTALEERALLVGLDQEHCAAFCSFESKMPTFGVGMLGLIAVTREARGKRWASRLIRQAARLMGAKILTTSTQVTNAPALRAFSRAGLLPFSARHVFHLWCEAT